MGEVTNITHKEREDKQLYGAEYEVKICGGHNKQQVEIEGTISLVASTFNLRRTHYHGLENPMCDGLHADWLSLAMCKREFANKTYPQPSHIG